MNEGKMDFETLFEEVRKQLREYEAAKSTPLLNGLNRIVALAEEWEAFDPLDEAPMRTIRKIVSLPEGRNPLVDAPSRKERWQQLAEIARAAIAEFEGEQ